jgi:ribosome biogenesis SPOUT family RNA methylase Rps3
MKYLIEHLDKRLYRWCILEYSHISKIVGRPNLIFTNIKTEKQIAKLRKLGKVYKESIKELASRQLKDKKICLLDADGKETLSPVDKKRFDILVFGGILGDFPPQKRTKKELGSLNLPLRSMGKEQMPTDNAVYVAKKIISGTELIKLTFIDEAVIDIKEGESVHLPFRYALVKGMPLMSEELIYYIKTKKGF